MVRGKIRNLHHKQCQILSDNLGEKWEKKNTQAKPVSKLHVHVRFFSVALIVGLKSSSLGNLNKF